ncbi:RNA polymerase sigma-70 factor (sigma-E family) [Nocardioides thalensis]|uniref:RNA polymerase sigma-70 factor (Sigma-E family) n=1 Tax=Nocardioides thalensis TaxID=1914755 RepID=A0A853C3R8_9ACTN|nr:RNA polymerase sigma-70 factor (sigma-E family) [Nocardioides thalensis]
MSGRDDFESFVAARRGALLKSAYLLTGSHADAEDLVQTTLIKVVPKWSRIADHPEPYVRRVLARESINRWRRRRWREVSTAVLPDSPVGADDGSERDILRAALLKLSPRQRAVVVLRYYEDLTERETAARLGLSLGTVKSYAREGLARLRTTLPIDDLSGPQRSFS